MKIKRFFAWIALFLLLGLYLSTIIFSLLKAPFAQTYLMLSLCISILLPILLYAIRLIWKVHQKKR